MKTINKYYKVMGMLSLTIALSTHTVLAQSLPADTTRAYLNKLMASQSAEDKALLNTKLQQLAASDSEKDMDMAINYYYNLKQNRISDSLLAVELTKFPAGARARSKAVNEDIFPLKTPQEKEAAYKVWIKKFPPVGSGEDLITYDYVVSSIAIGYAEEKNTAKAIEYAGKLQAEFWKGNGYSGLAQTFYKKGDIANAAVYYKKAIDSTRPFYEGKMGDGNAAKFSASGYLGMCLTYAGILIEQKKYDEALKYADISMKGSKTPSPFANFQYAKILIALNRKEEAYTRLEEAVKSGKANDEMSAAFKKLYITLKGSEAGFDTYKAEIRNGIIANLQQKLNKEMTKSAAADFNLTDLQGNKVSLSSLKGKVVILDFWATWCAPCKASFPAMQMAVNKFKADPKVAFLFIHTWEKDNNAVKDADEYIKSQKYTFQVLMDLKDPETKTNKVVSDYKVKGIPSKFVIDPQGNIRFSLMGFDGSNEAAVDEISMMIDMAKKG
jgi:thiol-disulfide isomerase/thioredoxin